MLGLQNNDKKSQKKFFIFFKKSIDNRLFLWYTLITKEGEVRTTRHTAASVENGKGNLLVGR